MSAVCGFAAADSTSHRRDLMGISRRDVLVTDVPALASRDRAQMRIFMLVQRQGIRGPTPKQTPHLVAALRSLGCIVVTQPWGRRSDNERLVVKATQRLRDVVSIRRALQGREFDVAVIQTAHDWRTVARDIVVVVAIRRRCRPVILHLHGSRASTLMEPGHRAFKLATAVLLLLVDGVMVLSTEEQRLWQAFRRHPSVFTVKNPFVGNAAARRHAVEAPAAEADRVLFVGRLLEAKGIFDLLEAFARVVGQARCELVVVGRGKHERRLRREISRLGLEEHVRMKGYLTGADLDREYAEATLLVLPTSWNEGFPAVLAEAMDAGLAIVTTRIRGAADHLVEGKHALFVDPRDVRAIASAILKVLHDRELRERMGSANRQRVRIFDPEVVGAEYLQVLRSLARLPPPAES
jgi:glycosyltransferase involved in cell wall biosynthesis